MSFCSLPEYRKHMARNSRRGEYVTAFSSHLVTIRIAWILGENCTNLLAFLDPDNSRKNISPTCHLRENRQFPVIFGLKTSFGIFHHLRLQLGKSGDLDHNNVVGPEPMNIYTAFWLCAKNSNRTCNKFNKECISKTVKGVSGYCSNIKRDVVLYGENMTHFGVFQEFENLRHKMIFILLMPHAC